MNAGEGVEGGAVMTERELIGHAAVMLSQVVKILRMVAEGERPIIDEAAAVLRQIREVTVTAEDPAV